MEEMLLLLLLLLLLILLLDVMGEELGVEVDDGVPCPVSVTNTIKLA